MLPTSCCVIVLAPRASAADRILERARDADEVHAVVDVEALVLDRDEGLPDVERETRERHIGAPLGADLAEEGTLAAQDEGGLRGRDDLPGFAGGRRGGDLRRGRQGGEERKDREEAGHAFGEDNCDGACGTT